MPESLINHSTLEKAYYKLDKAEKDLKNNDRLACIREIGEIFSLLDKPSKLACNKGLDLLGDIIPSCASDKRPEKR